MNQTDKPILGDRFSKALVYASQLHVNQVRKGSSIPYVSHLLSVTALVLEDGGNEDEAIAALLHDAVEDQGGEATYLAIQEKFGDAVASIVKECSESTTIPKPPWKERKLASLEHLRQANPSVRRVMLADKLHNARSILADYYRYGDTVWSRFKAGKEGTLWYYNSIAEIVRQTKNNFLETEIIKVVEKLNRERKKAGEISIAANIPSAIAINNQSIQNF